MVEGSVGKKPKMNIMIIGDSAVGKTSLLNMYDTRLFNKQHIKTIGVDKFVTEHNIQGHDFTVFLWDSAGQQQYHDITQSFYKKADALIIVFDLTQPNTFKSVTQWVSGIHQSIGPGMIKMLVGNKVDLVD